MKNKYLILIILLCLWCFGGCNSGLKSASNAVSETSDLDIKNSASAVVERLNYSNDKTAEELITIYYSEAQLDQLEKRYINGEDLTFDELSNEFKFECIRKAGSSYYAILMQDDGTKAFLFFRKDMSLRVFSRYTNFLSKDDFDFLKIGETTMEEVFENDPNSLLLPFSSSTTTAHIVKEGGIFIDYDKSHGAVLVSKIEFLDNNRISNLEDDDITLYSIPYILDIDKQ